ncbi:conserved hypothetical protein [Ricinus communis]|uniref:Uncharacterized protein n=1 Tax=Ricinus communis TaxID=3988 RepID=B9T4S1_RICCO|nr:conserved hypothetical protein [Ricinus communis]
MLELLNLQELRLKNKELKKIIVIGILALAFFLILKPQEPKFSLSTIEVDSYRLSVYSGSSLFISSNVSLILNAINHNKVGIRYSPSCLNLYYHGIQIGVVKIPGFYQPANSDNVGVITKISLHCINVSQIINEGFLQKKASKKVVQMKLIGDIRVQLRLLHLTMPKMKVALECDIGINYAELPFENYELFNKEVVQEHLASLPVNSGSFSKNCTLALYI